MSAEKPRTCRRHDPPCDSSTGPKIDPDGRGFEQCEMCGESLPHDYVHWNGEFDQCEQCQALEALDPDLCEFNPDRTFRQGMRPIYGDNEEAV